MTTVGGDLLERPGGFAITDRALVFCGLPKGARLLDVGCGSGATVRYAHQEFGLDSHGIDKDETRVRHRSRLACARGENLPFRAGVMDGVLLECSLSVMADPDRVLQECHRVLRPTGWLMLSDVYARGAAAALNGCLGRVEASATIIARVARPGFEIQKFEDFSSHLLAQWGQKIFDRGAAAFCAELGTDPGTLKALHCGYCLIIARRVEP